MQCSEACFVLSYRNHTVLSLDLCPCHFLLGIAENSGYLHTVNIFLHACAESKFLLLFAVGECGVFLANIFKLIINSLDIAHADYHKFLTAVSCGDAEAACGVVDYPCKLGYDHITEGQTVALVYAAEIVKVDKCRTEMLFPTDKTIEILLWLMKNMK